MTGKFSETTQPLHEGKADDLEERGTPDHRLVFSR